MHTKGHHELCAHTIYTALCLYTCCITLTEFTHILDQKTRSLSSPLSIKRVPAIIISLGVQTVMDRASKQTQDAFIPPAGVFLWSNKLGNRHGVAVNHWQ